MNFILIKNICWNIYRNLVKTVSTLHHYTKSRIRIYFSTHRESILFSFQYCGVGFFSTLTHLDWALLTHSTVEIDEPKCEIKDKNSHVTMLLFSIIFEVCKKWCELRFALFEWNDHSEKKFFVNWMKIHSFSVHYYYYYINGMWIVWLAATIENVKKKKKSVVAHDHMSIHCLLFEM